MLCQQWIVEGNTKIFTVQHWPDVPIPMGTVILLPGCSHAMCDMDYFMSRLARGLCARGFFVAQADLRGHGDGAGDFSDVSLATLQEDIAIVINHYSNMSDQLFCIGRGLNATMLAGYSGSVTITGMAGVGPYCLPAAVAGKFANAMQAAACDAYEVFPGNDYVSFSDFEAEALYMLNALGAVPYNLHGMEMSAQLLQDLAAFDAVHCLQHAPAASKLWLFRGDGPDNILSLSFNKTVPYSLRDLFGGSPLPREPRAQSKFLSVITDWILDSAYKLN